MVWGHVGHNRHLGTLAHADQLEAGKFHNSDISRGNVRQLGQQGCANVAAQEHLAAGSLGVGPEQALDVVTPDFAHVTADDVGPQRVGRVVELRDFGFAVGEREVYVVGEGLSAEAEAVLPAERDFVAPGAQVAGVHVRRCHAVNARQLLALKELKRCAAAGGRQAVPEESQVEAEVLRYDRLPGQVTRLRGAEAGDVDLVTVHQVGGRERGAQRLYVGVAVGDGLVSERSDRGAQLDVVDHLA